MAALRNCPECGSSNPEEYYFCRTCGHPLHDEQFPNELYSLPALKIQRMMGNLDSVPHKPVPWDKTIDNYVRAVEEIEAIFMLPEMGSETNKDLEDKIKSFYDLCHNPNFQIAFVGTIKTGKSTLINALLGRNYASMEVTPETAALTKFRSSVEDFVKVTFYTREEWNKLWASRTSDATTFDQEYKDLNAEAIRDKWVGQKPYFRKLANEAIEDELKRWSSSRSAEHFFVKEIEVGISTLTGVPPEVVFVDTPGLLDPVAYRSEITRDYIRSANAVFVCVDAQKIHAPEIETIASVFNFSSNKKDKVYIIATHWDKLNNPEKDWEKQKPFFAKQLSNPGFFNNEKEADENIIHAAAYLYNIARDYPNVTPDEGISLQQFLLGCRKNINDIEGNKSFIQDKANIKNIQKVIQDKLVENYKNLRTEEIQGRYGDILFNLERIMEETKNELSGLLDESSSTIEELIEQISLKESDKREIEDASAQLMALMDQMCKETDEIINKICGNLRKHLGA